MPRTYSWNTLKTVSRHPKCAFHARYDWKITFSRLGTKKMKKRLRAFFLGKMSHSAEKRKGGTLWDSITYILLKNIKKLKGRLFWVIKKFLKKNSHSAEKNWKGGPFGLFRFCRLRKKGKKWKGGPFGLFRFCRLRKKVKNERGDPLH